MNSTSEFQREFDRLLPELRAAADRWNRVKDPRPTVADAAAALNDAIIAGERLLHAIRRGAEPPLSQINECCRLLDQALTVMMFLSKINLQ